MICPKCHANIDDNTTVCSNCHKVLQLECPNCHSLGEASVCEKCGYTILVKCSKCGKTVPTSKKICKCGFPVSSSLANQECESDEFASILIKFGSLKAIKKSLKSQELYTKFFYKLKNLLFAQVKGVDCKLITYNDTFVINLNKELSFATSTNKAIRLALKIINSFVVLNSNILQDFFVPLNLTLTITKKSAENLQDLIVLDSNVKPLMLKKNQKKYLKGMQIVVDQFVCDEINKNYKLDSVYSVEQDGQSIMFYEIILDSYVLPPSEEKDESSLNVTPKSIVSKAEVAEKDMYSFNVFDINAKCFFEKVKTSELFEKLSNIDLDKKGKIISLKSTKENAVFTSDIVNFYEKQDYRVLSVACTEEMLYKPWGFFEVLFRDYFGLEYHNNCVDLSKIDSNYLAKFKTLFNFILKRPTKALTPEDARFAYMEQWNEFLSILDKTVIVVEGFQNLDDTSIQTLELYFDKFKSVKPNFVFITSRKVAVHTKIKELLRTSLYTEFSLQKSTMDDCLATLKLDATDFIQSFYFEKIKENFKGSYLYFKNAIDYLLDTGVLLNFEGKLLIKNNKSVVVPKDLQDLYRERIKYFSKNNELSFIIAFTSFFGARLDVKMLELLGIQNAYKNVESLAKTNFVRQNGNIFYVNNFVYVSSVIKKILKKEAEQVLAKTILSKSGKGLDDASLAIVFSKLDILKEQYLTLWRNAQFSIKIGDYDAYLKNCLAFLSLVEHLDSNISQEDIEENKKEVYNNILMCLYSYSPSKIYFIENLLLMDAINQGDDEKIVKLSNLMLQGALISSNYTDALGLLHNILSRMKNPVLQLDGNVNTKFLLLSLVNIEILYNIGDFKQCVEVAEEILSVLSPEILNDVKPASFSVSLFINHLMETFRIVGFSKLFLMQEDFEEYFEKIERALGAELPEKDCILAIKDFLAGKVYNIGNIESYTPFSKVIFLILQEFSVLENDYKRFAQNIYQAKILASEIHQREIELFCDLMIAYAYSKNNVLEKSEVIYKDVLSISEKSAMFNLLALSKYLIALQKKDEKALLHINDVLALLRKYDNQAKILYALLEKLYIDMMKEDNINNIDLGNEELKLAELKEPLALILK